MTMRIKAVCFGSLVTGLCFIATCLAEELPKSGTISIHTGWKVVAEPIDMGSKVMQGHGSVVGVSFNDKGSGPLHGGPAICFFTFFARDGGDVSKGYCAFGDVDGDKIFTDWEGKNNGTVNQGINRIAGGTVNTKESPVADRGKSGIRERLLLGVPTSRNASTTKLP